MAKELNTLMSANLEVNTKEKYRKKLKRDEYNQMFDMNPKNFGIEIFIMVITVYLIYLVIPKLAGIILIISISVIIFDNYKSLRKINNQKKLNEAVIADNPDKKGCFNCGNHNFKSATFCLNCGEDF